MKLFDFIDRHQGQHAWIIGKGPGLDAAVAKGFAPMTNTGIRCAINEVGRMVPNPMYVFATDVNPSRAMKLYFTQHTEMVPGSPTCVISPVFQDCPRMLPQLDLLRTPAHELAERNTLYGCGGTLIYAIHFLWLTGISRITLVGCEGTGGYAKVCAQQPARIDQWSRIRTRAEIALDVLGLHWEDWS